MSDLMQGLRATFSARGIGAALGLLIVLVALNYLGWGPDRIAARLRGAA